MQADERTDIEHLLLARRRVPCICPAQFMKASGNCGVAFAMSRSRGILVERVRCNTTLCGRTWTRITIGDDDGATSTTTTSARR